MDIKQILKEEILKEYAQKVVQELISKFKQERPDLNDEQFTYYINRFEASKASPKIVEKDIKKYTFAQLEKAIDALPVKGVVSKDITTAQIQSEAIYNQGGIQIYKADSRDKAIKYRKAFEGDTGESYSWCIARADSSNLYTGYRYGKSSNNPRIFYFVIDKNLPTTTPNHAFVVHAFDNGDYGYTCAFNDGDTTDLSEHNLLKLAPNLSTVQIGRFFQPKPLTEEEKIIYETTRERKTFKDDLIEHFGSHEMVKNYIEIHQHKLSEPQIVMLLHRKANDLVNLYINIGFEISPHMLKELPENLRKNYARVSATTIREYIKQNYGEDNIVTSDRVVFTLGYGAITQEEAFKMCPQMAFDLMKKLCYKKLGVEPNLLTRINDSIWYVDILRDYYFVDINFEPADIANVTHEEVSTLYQKGRGSIVVKLINYKFKTSFDRVQFTEKNRFRGEINGWGMYFNFLTGKPDVGNMQFKSNDKYDGDAYDKALYANTKLGRIVYKEVTKYGSAYELLVANVVGKPEGDDEIFIHPDTFLPSVDDMTPERAEQYWRLDTYNRTLEVMKKF